MNIGRLARRMTVVMLASLALGCYDSESPLDPAPPAQADSRLLGDWRCVGQDPTDNAITIRAALSPNRMYAMTWEESGNAPEHYEGFLTVLKDTTVFNVRDMPAKPKSHWSLVHVTFLKTNIALIQMVNERLLKGLSTAAVRATLEQQRENPALYEDDPLVCIHGRP